jgi:hypothetical protein
MSIEALLWGLLPTVLAVCSVFVSLFVAFRTRRLFHFLVSILVIAGVAWSLLILSRIFVLGAWPTYLPHVAIGGVVIIVITQTLLFRRTRHEVA